MATRFALLSLFVGTLSACSGDKSPTRPTPIPLPAPSYTLHIMRTAGVVGSPAVDSIVVDSGQVVNYSYQPESGYSPLTVLIDSSSAPASGSIVMNRTRDLAVGASLIPVGTASDSAVAALARAVTSSAAPVEAVQRLLVAFDSVARGRSPSETVAAFQTIIALAHDSTVSPAAWAATEAALAGQVFTLDPPDDDASVLPSRRSVGAASDPGGVPITIIFSNGIKNNRGDFAASLNLLKQLLGETPADRGYIPHAPGSRVRLIGVYNPTERRTDCLGRLWRDAFWLNPVEMLKRQLFCGFGAGDHEAALRDMASIAEGGPPSADADTLAKRIREQLREGRGVIVVGHSRGTLVAQQALNILDNDPTSPGDPRQCIGFVSIASPLYGSQVRRSELLKGWIAQGTRSQDVLLYRDGPFATGLATDLTKYWDEEIARTRRLKDYIRSALEIHSFRHYITTPPVAHLTRLAVASIAGQIQEGCRAPTPTPPRNSFSIGVSASPLTGGTVAGGGTYPTGSEVMVTATAADGFRFYRWMEGGTQVSTSDTLKFPVEADRYLIAEFARPGSHLLYSNSDRGGEIVTDWQQQSTRIGAFTLTEAVTIGSGATIGIHLKNDTGYCTGAPHMLIGVFDTVDLNTGSIVYAAGVGNPDSEYHFHELPLLNPGTTLQPGTYYVGLSPNCGQYIDVKTIADPDNKMFFGYISAGQD